MKLTVTRLRSEDAWKDFVLIPNDDRKDRLNEPIPRGTICRISLGGRSKAVIVAGLESPNAEIGMDLNIREALDVTIDKEYDFTIN